MILQLLLLLAMDSTYIANPVVTGKLERGLEEVSGIVASRQHRGLFWVHNDSGDGPVIYAIDSMGRRLCAYEFNSEDVVRSGSDWEDITYGWKARDSDTTYHIYVGDIGDNNGNRDFISIYQMREGANMKCVRAEKLEPPRPFSSTRRGFVYPDGARDAETLLFDPLTQSLYIVSKREQRNRVYKVPDESSQRDDASSSDEKTPDTLEFKLDLPIFGSTGGDISTDGTEILIKTYTHVYRWRRSPNESVEDALARKPDTLNYAPEPQGEAICFNASNAGFYTVSEAAHNGQTAPLYYYARTRTKPDESLIVTRSKKRPIEFTISYELGTVEPVILTIHNELMMPLRVVVDGSQKAGKHKEKVDLSTAPPGTYVAVLRHGAFYDAVPFTIAEPPAKPAPVATEKRKRKKSSQK